MPRRKDPPAEPPASGVHDYRHDARRLNNPPAGLVSADHAARETRRARYAYDPHLSPQLVWAGKPGLKALAFEPAHPK